MALTPKNIAVVAAIALGVVFVVNKVGPKFLRPDSLSK